MSLKRFNLLMGLLHLAQGAAMVTLTSDFALPVTGSFVEINQTTGQLEPRIRELFELRIGWLVAGFLFLSALAHLLIASPGIHRWYLTNLGRRINHARWIEYGLSSSLMIVVIAMLVGIYDIAALLAIFGANAAMIAFGEMMERHNQDAKETRWAAYWLGSAAGAIPWIAIGIYLFSTPGVPTFVYWIYASILVFFNAFPVNMWLQYRGRGRWRDYLFGERVYMYLSLVAKSLLAWQVFVGTLRPV